MYRPLADLVLPGFGQEAVFALGLTAVMAFMLTVVMEWPVLAWGSGLGFARTGLPCLGINGVSWGSAMGLREIFDLPILPLEGAIVLLEAALLRWWWPWRWARAGLLALAMNAFSFFAGVPLLAWLLRFFPI